MTDDQAVPQARERAYQDWWCNALEPWLDDPAKTREVSREAFCAGWDGGAAGERERLHHQLAGSAAFRRRLRGIGLDEDEAMDVTLAVSEFCEECEHWK